MARDFMDNGSFHLRYGDFFHAKIFQPRARICFCMLTSSLNTMPGALGHRTYKYDSVGRYRYDRLAVALP